MRLEIRTSDRIAFKRCRRKWSLSSQLRGNYTSKTSSKSELWFGSGFHFALEDYFGYNRFGSPREAFSAYTKAFKIEQLPSDYLHLVELANAMFDYYFVWQSDRQVLKTIWVGGKPLVELNLQIPLPELSGVLGSVFYSMTVDRVVRDPLGKIWIVDYKTYKKYDASKLPTDPQITSYLVMAELYLNMKIEGLIYWQFIKDIPEPPKQLKNGSFSRAANQSTTYRLYYKTLMDTFGKIPSEYSEILSQIGAKEDAEGDAFIRRDYVTRNTSQKEAEYAKIILEGGEMLNPTLPLYPNPTRDCIWDCNFRSVCLAMDDGSDWGHILKTEYTDQEEDEWRSRIKYPSEVDKNG